MSKRKPFKPVSWTEKRDEKLQFLKLFFFKFLSF